MRGAVQIKPGVQFGHVVMNVLIDHGAIERIGLVEDERAGQELLNNGPIWQNLLKVLCNAPSGPVEMQRKGNNNNVWPWTYAAPEPLLDAVRSAPRTNRDIPVIIQDYFPGIVQR